MNRKPDDDLDTETTIADMNVDGFRWYNPRMKRDKKKGNKTKVTGKEYWAMVKGAFLAIAPFVLGLAVVMGLIYVLCYFWLMK